MEISDDIDTIPEFGFIGLFSWRDNLWVKSIIPKNDILLL